MRRNVAGERPNICRKISLKRRTLLKPDASATSAIESWVSWINCLASNTRRVCATAIGDAPTCWRNSPPRVFAPADGRRAAVRGKRPPQLPRADAEPVGQALDIVFIETAGFDQ